MGSPPNVRGSQTGWLATLGCCAPRSSTDDEAELRENDVEKNISLCFEQPQVAPLAQAVPASARPSTSHSMSKHISHLVASGRDLAASTRASLSIPRPSASHHRARPSIGAPTDFRRIEEEQPQPRQRFRPLQLSIYLPDNRLSPLPDFGMFDWGQKPQELIVPEQAHVRSRNGSVASAGSFLVPRKPLRSSLDYEPLEHGRSPSSMSTRTEVARPAKTLELIAEDQGNPAALPRPLTSTSATQPARPRLNSPARGRSFTDPGQSVRKSSSLRHLRNDVDDAIRELNTIVEERRAAGVLRPAGTAAEPAPHHIPAIAPSLRMHVRSETLSDIGSAFSVPLASKPLPSIPVEAELSSSVTSYGLVAPTPKNLVNDPIAPEQGTSRSQATTSTDTAFSGPRVRLTSWLRKFQPDPAPPTLPGQFYQCQPPPSHQLMEQHRHRRTSSTSTASSLASVPSLCQNASVVTQTPSPPTPSNRSRSFSSARPPPRRDSSESAVTAPLRKNPGLSLFPTPQVPPAPPAYHEVDPHPQPAAARLSRNPQDVGMAF